MKEIEKIFCLVVGELAWGIHQTHGSCFFIEFGDPHIETIGPLQINEGATESQIARRRRRRVTLHGEWTMLVKDCSWELKAWESFATQDVDALDMEPAFEAASGQYLKSIKCNESDKSCLLVFDMGASLRLWPRPDGDPDEDQWRLHSKDGSSVGYTNDGLVSVESARDPNKT